LVVFEIALALSLLVAASLLIRSFATLLDWRPGFERSRLLVVSVFVPIEKYNTRERLATLMPDLERTLTSLPGVHQVGSASAGPLFGGEETGKFRVAGHDYAGAEDAVTLRWYDVSTGFHATLGLPLLRGRWIQESDNVNTPLVALINNAAARKYWPGQNPIGQQVRHLEAESDFQIIGVVADVQPFDPTAAAQAEIYWSNRQAPRPFTYLLLRTNTDPAQRASAVERTLQRYDPDFAVGHARSLNELVDRRLVTPRFQMMLIAAFATIALALASAGVFSVLAYSVALRRTEFGIRVALGARPRQLVTGVLTDGLVLSLTGLGLGLFGAFALARTLERLLVRTSPTEPAAYLMAIVVLAVVCTLASLVPAWRATRISPSHALRSE
jgi:putative ABC transport system permease protein